MPSNRTAPRRWHRPAEEGPIEGRPEEQPIYPLLDVDEILHRDRRERREQRNDHTIEALFNHQKVRMYLNGNAGIITVYVSTSRMTLSRAIANIAFQVNNYTGNGELVFQRPFFRTNSHEHETTHGMMLVRVQSAPTGYVKVKENKT